MHPLTVARGYVGQPLALLYSRERSLLAVHLQEAIEGDATAPFAARLSTHCPPLDNAWFGYLGYGLRGLPPLPPATITLPPLWMGQFAKVKEFTHVPPAPEHYTPPRTVELASNMTKAEYAAHARTIIDAIHAGALYQANLTRKFYGRFAAAPDTLALFARLCAISPAEYSAYLRLPSGTAILSSSPERFLHIDATGHATTRPIKGSAARLTDPAQDAAAAAALALSAKDRAENLMIVDLMRNDLSRGCVAGSVTVDRLFEVTTHPTVHHLSSMIGGQKRGDISTLQLVEHCFPPGSMTGAPKLAAMRLIDALEGQERGVYSGALGWFGGDGSCDLSVVIRTLIIDGDRFEFQVGGGIVADSTPEAEWRETLVKARGLAGALNIPEEALAAL